jgi:hypothetical protein
MVKDEEIPPCRLAVPIEIYGDFQPKTRQKTRNFKLTLLTTKSPGTQEQSAANHLNRNPLHAALLDRG